MHAVLLPVQYSLLQRSELDIGESALCLISLTVSPNLHYFLWLIRVYPVHIYFIELPFHVQSVPLALLIEYDSSFYSASLTVLVVSLQKPLPFLPSPKCINLPLRWMDQNFYTYTHLDLHPSSETQGLFYPEKIS